MFELLEMGRPDAVLGLTEAFKKDSNPAKIDLGVGVYKDANGNTPIFNTVKEAERRLLDQEKTKSYLPIHGDAAYGAAVQALVFGAKHEALQANRCRTAHTPGGTGALRVAGDFLKNMFPSTAIWMSEPTWANHPNIFAAAGLEVKTYPYYNPATKSLDFESMITTLRQVPQGDAVLLHACCHNPTGVDPTIEQWQLIADVAMERKFLPLVDFAYQGLGDGLDEDAAGVRALCRPGQEMLVSSSFSKNFGLYYERTGALTLVAGSADAAEKAFSHVKSAIRANYSNPPAHGAGIVTTILGDAHLRRQWEEEVSQMRDRINGMRGLFVQTLKKKGVQQDFSFIAKQRGMFSFSGLNKDQVDTLRNKYAIYIVGGGRINVAGISEANIDRLCTAIADVL
jgi:aspartate/tyrosine/aromatic aminotransferase